MLPLSKICMIYSTILAVVADLEKSDFFEIFLNLHIKFTSWRWRHRKKTDGRTPITISRRFQKSNWFCSSTLNQVLKTTPIWWVLKTHTFREKDRYEWSPSPGTLFLGFQTIQIWHIYGESTTIMVAQSMYSLLEVPSNP